MNGPIWMKHSPKDLIQTIRLEKQPPIKRHQLQSILHPKTWLTSDEVDATCFLLAKKFPAQDGLQSCLFFQCLHQGGVVGTPDKPFVQVLNVNDNHWITASNIFCGKNELCIYDSLNVTITKKTEQKLSWLIRPQAPSFVIRRPAVQKQHSGSSCGLFALAFASVLCEGVRPEECHFKDKNMRQRLYRALTNKMAPVFHYQNTKPNPERPSINVEVHCICRTSHHREVMVQCSSCDTWYHPNCVSVPQKALDTTAEEWECESCKK